MATIRGIKLLPVTVTVALVATLMFGAAVIFAAPNLSPSGPYEDEDEVTVSGTAPSGTTHFAVAQCSVKGLTDPEDFGKKCHLLTSVAPQPLSSGTYNVDDFVLRSGWAPNFDFTGGAPVNVGGSTTCKTIGSDKCAVVVAFYHDFSGPLTFVTAEKVNVVFVP